MRKWKQTILGSAIGLIAVVGLAFWIARGADGPKAPKSRAGQTPKPATATDENRQPAAVSSSNRLARETSPYLLLHAHNPVDWYPWGAEAFAKAKAEDKPILLSIGYSSCYWCHVMERESFSDEAIAKILNDHFVCIKVDREERPDVDQIYMAAVQALGSGGWPLTVFLTPDAKPFFGGTYFPREDKEDMTGFGTLLDKIDSTWKERRKEVDQAANQLTAAVRQSLEGATDRRRVPLTRALAAAGVEALSEQFDPAYGGFGFDFANPRRPKFPEPPNLVYLLDQHRRLKKIEHVNNQADKPSKDTNAQENLDPLTMVLKTVDEMARGGIRDQLGGGYHRYSTNRSWTIPHFEKMLYDNAQIAALLVELFEITQDTRWKAEAEATLAFLAKSMRTPEGGFASALDAETEGQEGRTYVWTRDEIRQALADTHADAFASKIFGLDRPPNFEGDRYVLRRPKSPEEEAKLVGKQPTEVEAELGKVRDRLLAVRDKRPQPRKDDKAIMSWNALTISAFADSARVFHDKSLLQTGERAADFVLETLRDKQGKLLRTYRLGQAKLPASVEDYALLADALLRLNAAGAGGDRLAQARAIVDQMIESFEDTKEGGFFTTTAGRDDLLVRPKDYYDGVMPSGTSAAVFVLVKLAKLTKDKRYLDHAEKALRAQSGMLATRPTSAPLLLVALDSYLDQRPADDPGPVVAATREKPAAKSDTVSASAQLATGSRPVRGGEIEVEVTVDIKPGWHVYANPSQSDAIPPTLLTLTKAQSIKLTNCVYPEGSLKSLASSGTAPVAVYEKSATIKAKLELGKDLKPGEVKLVFNLTYQACDDRRCLAPVQLEINLPIAIE